MLFYFYNQYDAEALEVMKSILDTGLKDYCSNYYFEQSTTTNAAAKVLLLVIE